MHLFSCARADCMKPLERLSYRITFRVGIVLVLVLAAKAILISVPDITPPSPAHADHRAAGSAAAAATITDHMARARVHRF